MVVAMVATNAAYQGACRNGSAVVLRFHIALQLGVGGLCRLQIARLESLTEGLEISADGIVGRCGLLAGL